MKNQLIFTDLGVIVAVDVPLTDEQTHQLKSDVRAWIDGDAKVLMLRIADWEIIDKRTRPANV